MEYVVEVKYKINKPERENIKIISKVKKILKNNSKKRERER